MLANPYCKGDVIYRGVKYAGSHEPLVPPEVWYQVQNVLMAHNTAGDRTQRHDHYLKGILYCGSCGSRLVISNAKSRSGNIYPYFVCAGRHRKRTSCTRSAVLLDDAERLVIDYYEQNIQIPAHVREQLRGMLATEFDHLLASSEAELAELTARRDQLEAEQTKLIHAYYADAIALPALKREQDRISGELEHVNSRIEVFHGDYAAHAPSWRTAWICLATPPASTSAATMRPAASATRRSSPSSTLTRTTWSELTWPAPSRSCSTQTCAAAPRPGPTTLLPTPAA